MVYATSKDLGSPSKVWDNLTLMAKPDNFPVKYNLDGSYLTMWSRGGLIFGIMNIIGAPLLRCLPHGWGMQTPGKSGLTSHTDQHSCLTARVSTWARACVAPPSIDHCAL